MKGSQVESINTESLVGNLGTKHHLRRHLEHIHGLLLYLVCWLLRLV